MENANYSERERMYMYVCVCMGGGSGTSWHFIPLTGLSELEARGMLLKRQGGCPTLTLLRPFTFFHYTQATREGSRYFTLSKHLILAALGFMPPPPLVLLSRASFVASHIPPPSIPAKCPWFVHGTISVERLPSLLYNSPAVFLSTSL